MDPTIKKSSSESDKLRNSQQSQNMAQGTPTIEENKNKSVLSPDSALSEDVNRRISDLEAEKRKLSDDLKAAELKLFFLEVGDKSPSTPPRRSHTRTMEGSVITALMSMQLQDSPRSRNGGSVDSNISSLSSKDQSQVQQLLQERVVFLERQLAELSKKNEERMCILKSENSQLISELKSKCSRLTAEKTDLAKALELTTEASRTLDREMESLRLELSALKFKNDEREAALVPTIANAPEATPLEELQAEISKLLQDQEKMQEQCRLLTADRDEWRTKAEAALLAATAATAPETTTPPDGEDALGNLMEKYERLRSRVEELKNERDSYREAMMKVFEEANPANKTVPGVPTVPSVVPTVAADPSKNLSALSGFMNSNRQLQDHIAQLTRQNHELKQLERLRPQLMELQQRVALMQEENFKARVKFVEDTAALTESNQELQLQLKACNRSLDSLTADLREARAFADSTAQRLEETMSREKLVKGELEEQRRVAEEMAATAVDPARLAELEGLLAEAAGERKHWQSKAQSLSKDVQRMMGLAADLVQLKEENERVQHRLEEVETEKCAFKQAMQKAMAEKNPATTATPLSYSWF